MLPVQFFFIWIYHSSMYDSMCVLLWEWESGDLKCRLTCSCRSLYCFLIGRRKGILKFYNFVCWTLIPPKLKITFFSIYILSFTLKDNFCQSQIDNEEKQPKMRVFFYSILLLTIQALHLTCLGVSYNINKEL